MFAARDVYAFGTTSLDIVHLIAGGNVGISSYLNLSVTGDFIASGNVLLESLYDRDNSQQRSAFSGLLLTDAMFAVTGNTTFLSASDAIMSGGSFDIGGTWAVTAKDNVFMTDTNVIKADITNLTATRGDVSIAGSTVNLASLTASGKDISFDDLILTIAGEFNMNAKNNLLVKDSTIKANGISGDTTLTAGVNLAVTDSDITAAATNLTATDGDLVVSGGSANLGDAKLVVGGGVSLTNWVLTVEDNLDLDVAKDLIVNGGSAKLGSAELTSGGSISLTNWELTVDGKLDLDVTKDLIVSGGKANLDNANLIVGGSASLTNWVLTVIENFDLNVAKDLIVNGGSAELGNAKLASGGNVSLSNWVLTIAGLFNANARDNLSITDSNIEAGTTTLITENGDLTVNGGQAELGDTKLVSGGNITITNWLLTVLGSLDATAAKDFVTKNSTINTTGSKTLTSTGDLTFSDGSETLGNTTLVSGGSITMTNWSMEVDGKLDVTVANDISMNNANITTTGDLSTTGHDISIVGSTLASESKMNHIAGNNISIMDSNITVKDVYGITAANRLTIYNTMATIGDFAGNYGLADFDASGYRLLDWHFYTKTVLLSNIDIYNDPAYWNSLAYDRMTGRSGADVWLKNITGVPSDDYLDGLIKGSWLLPKAAEEEEDEELLKTHSEPGELGVPVAKLSVVRGW